MPAPLVTLYVTSLTSAAKVRKNTELLHRALRGFEIPYEAYDLVNDEDAKRRWQRAKPEGMVVGLPGYLVGGEWIGTMEDFEDAVETQTLETFLRQDFEMADASQTIGEAELDRLMREMTDEDLDSLVGHLSMNDEVAPVLPVSPVKAAAPATAATAATSTSSAAATSPIATTKALATFPKEDKTPTEEKSEAEGGLLAAASAAVTSAAAAVSETATKATETLKHAADEPASVTAKRASIDAGKSPADEKTLDDVIDATLAKEAVEEEKKEAEVKEAETKEAVKEEAEEKKEAAKEEAAAEK